jgi:rhodanese-related sulfurtransferase
MARNILAKDNAVKTAAPEPRSRIRNVLFEAVLVCVAGMALAFAANALSPRGLDLARNYFPGGEHRHAVLNRAGTMDGTNATATNAHVSGAIAARLQSKGLQPIAHAEVEQLFRDPRYEMGLIVLVDARNDQHYQQGHIPGAYQFDHFRPQNYMADVLPACLMAEQVIVYCSGGECEDSESAAIFLRDAGVANEKIRIYAGGIHEWTQAGLPIETGARKSGQLRQPAK